MYAFGEQPKNALAAHNRAPTRFASPKTAKIPAISTFPFCHLQKAPPFQQFQSTPSKSPDISTFPRTKFSSRIFPPLFFCITGACRRFLLCNFPRLVFNSRIMKSLIINAAIASLSATLLSAPTHAAQGRQLTGVYTPAQTPPLSPPEAQKKFTVPDGFEMRLFASEPMVVNPVAMTWDERGRLWVVELYEYPLGAPAGAKPRDQVKVLEDTDGDGVADKVTVFADGLNLATGIAVGNGGVYVGQAPHLLFFKDTNGDDKADSKEIVMTGFGMEDRHELLNSFAWGPDGQLYMTHGVFTFSNVKNPDDPNDTGVRMTAAVGRFDPKRRKFEVFAEGTSNPWGVDWDAAGNAFVSACVIDHLFHMAPGGIYVRQAGNPPNPYSYELIPSIVDHKHFRAAYAGAQVYQGNLFPDEYKGTIFMGNIHDSAVHQDKLAPNGSTFKASFIKDLIRTSDGWFRPVSSQVGPDGALWVMDWYDKYPCYQNANADPDGVDRTYGRIWRLVYTGDKKGAPVSSHPPGLDLGKASNEELVKTLAHANVWQRRMAQRVLNDRARSGKTDGVAEALRALYKSAANNETKMAALWTLYSTGLITDDDLDAAAKDSHVPARAWAARFTGERGELNDKVTSRLGILSQDNDVTVRVAVASAVRQFTSGSLTVDTPPHGNYPKRAFAGILGNLIMHPGGGDDPLLPFMIWEALEPGVAKDTVAILGFFSTNGGNNPAMGSKLIYKIMRRICDMQDPEQLNWAVEYLRRTPPEPAAFARAALDGLIDGQKGKAIVPSKSPSDILSVLSKNADKEIVSRVERLGALWGDAAALQKSLAMIANPSAAADERTKAINAVKQTKSDTVREALLKVLGDSNEQINIEIIRALGEVGGDPVPGAILAKWKQLTPATQRAAAEVLTSRPQWANNFLDAIQSKTVNASDVPAPVIRSLANSNNEKVRQRTTEIIGRVRESNADKQKLIADKKKFILDTQSQADINAGHELAKKTCFTCHKLYGEGADVGPDLTGVGRSTLDALLNNVIDPNQIVGKGYENVEIETKDGRTVSGRVVEETDSKIRLLSAGPKEETVAKSDIANKRASELSVMPEGLEQMPEADFRNLILYILHPPQEKESK
jgi:putative membrane-bound dehydrogenase-like protein